MECLTAEVGSLADRFGASQAWLYVEMVEDGERVLWAVVTHRTNQRGLRIVVGKDTRGIVAHVVRTRQPYLAKNIEVDEHYVPCSEWTISELAVPIFDGDGDRLLGVLNFESSLAAFTEEDLSELQVAAQRLAVAMLCLQRNSGAGVRHWPWTPANGNWNASSAPQQVCGAAVKALGLGDSTDTCSVIIWYVDWDKDELWVLGTTFYDSIYLVTKRFTMTSYTGAVAKKRRGMASLSSPEDDPRFVERERAMAAGLQRMASAPLYRAKKRAWGVLHSYFFGDEVDRICPSKDEFADFAFCVEEWLAEYERCRSDCAAAYVRWKMEASALQWRQLSAKESALQNGMLFRQQLNVLTDLLVDILAGDGCSIFAPNEKHEHLDMLTSTGVGLYTSFDGQFFVREPDNWMPVFYTLGDPDDELYGVLSFLSEHPDVGVVRINSLLEFEAGNEKGVPAEIPRRVVRKHMEPVSSDNGERRFLGIAVTNSAGWQIVVRVVRSTKKPPFTAEDASLFARVLRLCGTARLFGVDESDSGYSVGPGPLPVLRPR